MVACVVVCVVVCMVVFVVVVCLFVCLVFCLFVCGVLWKKARLAAWRWFHWNKWKFVRVADQVSCDVFGGGTVGDVFNGVVRMMACELFRWSIWVGVERCIGVVCSQAIVVLHQFEHLSVEFVGNIFLDRFLVGCELARLVSIQDLFLSCLFLGSIF